MSIHTDWGRSDPDGLDRAVKVPAKSREELMEERDRKRVAHEAGAEAARERLAKAEAELSEAEQKLANSAYGRLLASVEACRVEVSKRRDELKAAGKNPPPAPAASWDR